MAKKDSNVINVADGRELNGKISPKAWIVMAILAIVSLLIHPLLLVLTVPIMIIVAVSSKNKAAKLAAEKARGVTHDKEVKIGAFRVIWSKGTDEIIVKAFTRIYAVVPMSKLESMSVSYGANRGHGVDHAVGIAGITTALVFYGSGHELGSFAVANQTAVLKTKDIIEGWMKERDGEDDNRQHQPDSSR